MVKSVVFMVTSFAGLCISVLTIIYWGLVRDEASYLLPDPDIIGDLQWVALLLSFVMMIVSIVFFLISLKGKGLNLGFKVFTAIACIGILIFSITTAGISVKEKRDLNINIHNFM